MLFERGVEVITNRSSYRILIAGVLVFIGTAIVGFKISAWNHLVRNNQPMARSDEDGLVVHEWGTFTSIAGKDGVALEWRPLNAPTDLPAFVHTIEKLGSGLRHLGKRDLSGLVRMETPVLYFYSGKETEVSVKVDFPKGKITEWYPQARTVDSGVDWGRFKVMPGASMSLPASYSASHYYAARETDSAPLQVCGSDGKAAEQEKFLFYRGVGSFDLPLAVTLQNNQVELRNLTKDEIGKVILFENRGGKIGYRVINGLKDAQTTPRLSLENDLGSLLRDLEELLVTSGLYQREADAMIKTWRDSWFEEGMRVFYVLPRQTTDAVLPVTVDPQPTEMVRVLVGRAELITPEMEKKVAEQVKALGEGSPQLRRVALQQIRRYGRFSEPILKRILEHENDSVVRERIKRLIANA